MDLHSILSGIWTLILVVLFFVVAMIVIMVPAARYVFGFFVLLGLVIAFVSSFLSNRQENKLRDEFQKLQLMHGYNAREHCPHRMVTFSQTGVASVLTFTHKGCKICGKNLGPAKLKESIFGNRWV
jgi:energy-coupling factor transporter transmembrane protein EcfT